MNEAHIDPSGEQIAALKALDLEGPVTMVNLLRFAPDGGEERYARYGAAAMPFLQRVGATVRYLGAVEATVIGGEEWDEVILVEYPSIEAFFAMTEDPDYPWRQRRDALADSRLLCSQPGRS